jgi:ribose transport system substrate-binding protein
VAVVLAVIACTPGAPATQPAAPATAEPATPAAAAKGYNFAVIQAVVNPFYAPWPKAVEDAATDFGPGITVEVGSPQDFDQVQQNAVVDSFVAKGVTGIAIQPVDAVAGNETVKRLVTQGVVVVGVGACAEIEGTGAETCLNVGLQDSAYEAAKLVCTTIGGSGNIVHLDGALADKNTALRGAGVDKALAEMPDCKLLQRITDIDTAESAQNAVSSLLASRGSEVDGIVSTAYNPSVAIANEFRRTNEKRIVAVAVDIDQTVLDAIKDGYILATRAVSPYEIAYLGVLSLKLAIDGCEWKDPDFTLYVPYATVTADKVDTLVTDQEAAAKEKGKTWQADHWTCP